MAWSEERLHRWLARALRPERDGSRGVGHDAAVLSRPRGRPVACADQTIAGVHFDPDTPARRIGAKAAGRALSDLAATAAAPRALLVTLAAPPAASERDLRALLAAVRDRARAFGAELVGGDLAQHAGPLTVGVTAFGELAGRRRPVGRDRARPGQVVIATGPCGGSRLGRHLAIEPRVAAGRRLWVLGATAMIDVSDGLAVDLARVARASGVGVDLHTVPVHRDARRAARRSGRDAEWHALFDGEDHELVATLAPAAARRAARELGGLAAIGVVRPGRGLRLRAGDGWRRWDGRGGWRHGS